MRVDPDTGHTSKLLTETDPAWIDLNPSIVRSASAQSALPHYLADGSGFLWAAERPDGWQLELHHMDGSLDHALTPPGFHFDALDDVNGDSVTFTASPDRLDTGIFSVSLHGGSPKPVTKLAGLHDANFGEGHGLFTDRFSAANGEAGTAILRADGTSLGLLPSVAEAPPSIPKVSFMTVGDRKLDALVIRPSGFSKGRRYPVILSVYAGPTVKVVQRAVRGYLEDQCLADHGFIVVSVDGRGTPGRDSAFEHATKGDLIDLPLQDQVDGVQALGKLVPEMDLSRVGVTGWSFGGYFTAMATIRRPNVFKAGVAGRPGGGFRRLRYRLYRAVSFDTGRGPGRLQGQQCADLCRQPLPPLADHAWADRRQCIFPEYGEADPGADQSRQTLQFVAAAGYAFAARSAVAAKGR